MEPRITETGTLTTTMLILIAIFAAVTIAGILWGIRLKRARAEAAAIEAERIAEEGAAPIAAPEPVRVPPPPPPPAPQVATIEAPVAEPPVEAVPDVAPLADEPIAAAAPADASPATIAEPAAVPEPAGPDPADGPVTQLKGLGPKVAAMLAGHGITTVGDLAALDASQAEALDARLGAFTGRMARDRWIEQARFLAAGDKAGFEAVFGKL